MAQTVGFLRENSTYGEKETLKLLEQNLPKEYTVYVETPIRKKRDIRYPDFIILTNYGVVVLEVKDWVTIERADPSGAMVRTRTGESRHEKNPVDTAREYAMALSNQLNERRYHGGAGESIPWSYAAVLYNLPTPVITQLRRPWGEEFVFGKADQENPDILLNRIKNTFLVERMRALTHAELQLVRATIYPVVEFEQEGRASVILDEQQEKIVAEPVRQEAEVSERKARKAERERLQESLFGPLQVEEKPGDLPEAAVQLGQNVAIRLVRGFSGSGKTLVLIQRARFLSAQYPEWNIGVLTYNKLLQTRLEKTLRDSTIKPCTFHSLCCRWVTTPPDQEAKLEKWLRDHAEEFSILRRFSIEIISHEIDWLRDMGITELETYLGTERKGIGRELRLQAEERNALFDVYAAYRSYLRENGLWDWPEIPLLTLEAMDRGVGIRGAHLFDAVLIDEAQDWAPVWFQVVNRLVHPERGLIFLADDPSQSIYRYFSWKEKGVNVVGRTRWLRVPYRNTYEIYQAAYSLIADHPEIQKSLAEEGELIAPELKSESMRHGPAPLIHRSRSLGDELAYIKETARLLVREGYTPDQIAVLARHRRDVDSLKKALQGTQVDVNMIHSFKGLEMEAVIIPHLHSTFANPDDEASERRLLYMALSRARTRLYLTCSSRLPGPLESLRRQGLADFVE